VQAKVGAWRAKPNVAHIASSVVLLEWPAKGNLCGESSLIPSCVTLGDVMRHIRDRCLNGQTAIIALVPSLPLNQVHDRDKQQLIRRANLHEEAKSKHRAGSLSQGPSCCSAHYSHGAQNPKRNAP
jgi:hypothetical protein